MQFLYRLYFVILFSNKVYILYAAILDLVGSHIYAWISNIHDKSSNLHYNGHIRSNKNHITSHNTDNKLRVIITFVTI
jgi:hypothetical protein